MIRLPYRRFPGSALDEARRCARTDDGSRLTFDLSDPCSRSIVLRLRSCGCGKSSGNNDSSKK